MWLSPYCNFAGSNQDICPWYTFESVIQVNSRIYRGPMSWWIMCYVCLHIKLPLIKKSRVRLFHTNYINPNECFSAEADKDGNCGTHFDHWYVHIVTWVHKRRILVTRECLETAMLWSKLLTSKLLSSNKPLKSTINFPNQDIFPWFELGCELKLYILKIPLTEHLWKLSFLKLYQTFNLDICLISAIEVRWISCRVFTN